MGTTRLAQAWPSLNCEVDTAIIVDETTPVQQQWLSAEGVNIVPTSATLIVTDADGDTVMSKVLGDPGLTLVGSPQRVQMLFEVGSLPPGNYSYELRAGNGSATARLAYGLLHFTGTLGA